MIKQHTALLGGLALSLVVLLACACSSSSTSASAKASVAAEAQILPLRHLSAPGPALHAAINQLAGAYQQFFASNGKSASAKEAVSVASKKLNSICPGAAS